MNDYRVVLIVVTGIVILGALALWLGRGLRIQKDEGGFSIETDKTEPENLLSVAKEADIEAQRLGNVTGIKSDKPNILADGNIDVLEKSKVKVDEMGNIVGIEITSKSDEAQK